MAWRVFSFFFLLFFSSPERPNVCVNSINAGWIVQLSVWGAYNTLGGAHTQTHFQRHIVHTYAERWRHTENNSHVHTYMHTVREKAVRLKDSRCEKQKIVHLFTTEIGMKSSNWFKMQNRKSRKLWTFSLEGPSHPHRCLQLFWLIRPLLRLKVDWALLWIMWGHRTSCTNKNDKNVICPTLAGATKPKGEWGSGHSNTVFNSQHLGTMLEISVLTLTRYRLDWWTWWCGQTGFHFLFISIKNGERCIHFWLLIEPAQSSIWLNFSALMCCLAAVSVRSMTVKRLVRGTAVVSTLAILQ